MRSTFVPGLGPAVLAGVAMLAAVSVEADQYDRRVVIINNTDMELVEFYASNVGADDWQEDIFGDGTLSSGSSVTINIDDGTGYCRYDFRAVFANGKEAINSRINVCEAQSITYE